VSGLPRGWATGAAAVLAVAYGGLCKALLFRDLEYLGSDLFSFLEMSWSWYYAGLWMHDNIYGHHYALHNFNLVPVLSVLTIPLGAYGFVLGLVLLNGLAAWRVATLGALDLAGRLAVLGGLLSPVAYFAFDNPYWGFHPELCYPPLALLFAAELTAGERGRPLLAAAPLVLVKEDGAVLVACILVAHFASRLWALRSGPEDERRKTLQAAFRSLVAVTLVFAAGMAILALASRAHAADQSTSSPRVFESVRILALTAMGRGRVRRLVLQDGLVFYAQMAGLLLLPLARRLPRGLLLLVVSSPPLLVVLLVSAAGYMFSLMVWAPRVATLLGLVLACLVIASADAGAGTLEGGRGRVLTAVVLGLVALSWALQVPLLKRIQYPIGPRLDAPALVRERGYTIAQLPKGEVEFLRCLAARLPGGLPLAAPEGVRPFFHRQSIVLEQFAQHAWHPARFRIVPSGETPSPAPETPCPGPRRGAFAVQAECSLVPLVAGCPAEPPASGAHGGEGNARAISSSREELVTAWRRASTTSAPLSAVRGLPGAPGSRESAMRARTAKVH
jgi:hypothetical protein